MDSREKRARRAFDQIQNVEVQRSCFTNKVKATRTWIPLDIQRNKQRKTFDRVENVEAQRSSVTKRSNTKTKYLSARHRYVSRKGKFRTTFFNNPGVNKKALKDIFHWLVDIKWISFLFLFTASFSLSWLFFGGAWFLLVWVRSPHLTCVDNVDTFVKALLFSIETQVSIGYGVRAITSQCPEGIFLLIFQIMLDSFFKCIMLGILFKKLGTPSKRGKTVMFSKHAVIQVRNGQYCLIYKYVDFPHCRLLNNDMRLLMVRSRMTKEGEYLPVDMADMALTIDQKQIEYTCRLFPLYPLSLIHVIDEQSPLYKMNKESFEQDNFEIVSIAEGDVPGTGDTTKAVASFKSRDILWGHRFCPCYLDKNSRHNNIDLSRLNDTYRDRVTPLCSAEEYQGMEKNNNITSPIPATAQYQRQKRLQRQTQPKLLIPKTLPESPSGSDNDDVNVGSSSLASTSSTILTSRTINEEPTG